MNLILLTIQSVIKTAIDYFFSILCLILSIPLLLCLSLLIKLSGNGPVIFSQERIGRYGKPFKIYKLRSMYYSTDNGLSLISDRNDKRITPVGRFMRKHKFDEIPNFFNVLKGEMSIVGPRPEQKYYIDQILIKAPEYNLIKNIKPGITSWGQVKYGYASTVDEMIERLEYDLYYLEHRSLWFDLKIALCTVYLIMKGQRV